MYFPYPVPCIVIDIKKVIHNYLYLQRIFPKFCIAYSIKANPHIQILKALFNYNAYFEVASQGEFEILEKIGVPLIRIIFSNPVKPLGFIQKIAEKESPNGSPKFLVVDSITELQKIQPYKDKNIKVLIRLSVSNIGSQWPLSNKFGVKVKNLFSFAEFASQNAITIDGFTFHVGSQNDSIQAWKDALKKVLKAKNIFKKHDINVATLNVGGGFSTSMLSSKKKLLIDIAKMITNSVVSQFSNFYMEPGRYLVANAGKLYSKVIGIAYRNNKKWVYLDVGVFHGLFESIEGIHYPCKNLSNPNGKLEKVILTGPSCDSLDTIGKFLIESISINDIVCFSLAGAYTHVYASHFNGIKIPKIIIQH